MFRCDMPIFATMERREKRIEVNEMMMLRCMCGVTRNDKIGNEHIRGTTRVAQASKKITRVGLRLNGYGHVIKSADEHIHCTEESVADG